MDEPRFPTWPLTQNQRRRRNQRDRVIGMAAELAAEVAKLSRNHRARLEGIVAELVAEAARIPVPEEILSRPLSVPAAAAAEAAPRSIPAGISRPSPIPTRSPGTSTFHIPNPAGLLARTPALSSSQALASSVAELAAEVARIPDPGKILSRPSSIPTRSPGTSTFPIPNPAGLLATTPALPSSQGLVSSESASNNPPTTSPRRTPALSYSQALTSLQSTSDNPPITLLRRTTALSSSQASASSESTSDIRNPPITLLRRTPALASSDNVSCQSAFLPFALSQSFSRLSNSSEKEVSEGLVSSSAACLGGR
ncbi:hypothetical protein V8F33_004318 [Rhypophila sp. PSN 637]